MPQVSDDARLAEYQPYWAARAELLAKTAAYGEARQAYDIAIGLERDPAVRRFLQERRSAFDGLWSVIPARNVESPVAGIYPDDCESKLP